MKKTFLILILVLALAVTVLPTVMAAGENHPIEINLDPDSNRVMAGNDSYQIMLGQLEDGRPGGQDFAYALADAAEETQFDCYLFLMNDMRQEAPEKVYKAFWEQCKITLMPFYLENDDPDITLGALTAVDGLRARRFPVTVKGRAIVNLRAYAEKHDSTDRAWGQVGVRIAVGETITLANGAGSLTFRADPYVPYFFYADLGEKHDGMTVTAQMAGARGSIRTDPTTFLWTYFEGSSAPNTIPRPVQDRYARFIVTPFSDTDGPVSVTLSVTARETGFDPGSGNFFVHQAPSEENRLKQSCWYALPEAEGGKRAIWYLAQNGFPASQRSNVTVNIDGQPTDDIQWVKRGQENVYDLKILLPEYPVEEAYDVEVLYNGSRLRFIRVRMEMPVSAAYVGDLVIGFSKTQNDGETVTIEEENGWVIGSGTVGDATTGYEGSEPITIRAAIKQQEGTSTVYAVDQAVTNSLRITNLTITPIAGDSTVFSLDGQSLVLKQTGFTDNTATVHFKGGLSSYAILTAEISGHLGNTPFTVTASTRLRLNKLAVETQTRPANDTVEALNAELMALASSVRPGNETPAKFWVTLADTTYDGTIVIPDLKNRNLSYSFNSNGNTTIRGGIDLNNGLKLEHIQNIVFVAPEKTTTTASETTRAIWNGSTTFVSGCTFRGYDIALDSGKGLINPTEGNVFVDNTVAVSVNFRDAQPDSQKKDWMHNTFLRNDTAVQVLSLAVGGSNGDNLLTPYYFRLLDSNFIGNGLDFDFREDGRFYMYRNYYAKIHPQAESMNTDDLYAAIREAKTEKAVHQLVIGNSPEIGKENNKSKVITNPRWKYPVREALVTALPASAVRMWLLTTEEPYTNCLIIDWSQETEILTGMADDLTVSAEAFGDGGDKTITVLQDNTEDVLGFWTFSAEPTE